MTEAVVVADDECTYFVTAEQYVAHEVVGRHLCELWCEVEVDDVIDAVGVQQCLFLVGRGEQWHRCGGEHGAWMRTEGDDCRCVAASVGLGRYLTYEVLVSEVYSVEESYGCYFQNI